MPTYTDEQRAEAEWYYAFGEPARLTILRTLATGPAVVKALTDACALSQRNISYHLAILKRAGLVAAERDGRFQRCSLVGAKVTKTAIEFTGPNGLKVTVPRR